MTGINHLGNLQQKLNVSPAIALGVSLKAVLAVAETLRWRAQALAVGIPPFHVPGGDAAAPQILIWAPTCALSLTENLMIWIQCRLAPNRQVIM